MVNPEKADLTKINLKTSVRIHKAICRNPWAKLWYYCRAIDTEGSGNVIISVPELITLLGRSRATIYRWLKDGKEAGAFKRYEKIGEHFEKVYLGSKEQICEQLHATDWGSVTYIPLGKILQPFKKKPQDTPDLREQATAFQTQWLEKRSEIAAKKEARQNKDRRKPYKTDFSGATDNPTSPILPPKFSRGKLPTGATQEKIAESLGVSSRTVRRHLKTTRRQQVYHKIPKQEAEGEMFFAREKGEKAPIFERKGEYFKYGCNQYDLNFEQKSEWIQRLKYKFKLLTKKIVSPEKEDKFKLSIEEKLDNLDEVILIYLKFSERRSFKNFLKEVYKIMNDYKREKRRRRTM